MLNKNANNPSKAPGSQRPLPARGRRGRPASPREARRLPAQPSIAEPHRLVFMAVLLNHRLAVVAMEEGVHIHL